jgi:pilus assembly protein FimV
LAVLLLSAVSTAGAAGLGRLAVQSALGEAFRAEIELLSYQDGFGAPVPRLSSPDLYRLVDFRYNAALAGAQLNIRKQADGRHVLEIVSARRIDEPFLHLLVELEHNATRIIRGYTVLLDPYGYAAPGAPVVAYAPVIFPAALPAAIAAAPSPAAPPPVAPRAPAPKAVAAAPAAPDAGAAGMKQIRQLEEQLGENTRTLAGMLERVAAMEQMVKQLQEALARPAAAPPPGPAPPPPVAKAPSPPADLPPRRERSWTKTVLDEALLILAGGALLLVFGLGYWMWGRAPAKTA